jgi:hypothetical protein
MEDIMKKMLFVTFLTAGMLTSAETPALGCSCFFGQQDEYDYDEYCPMPSCPSRTATLELLASAQVALEQEAETRNRLTLVQSIINYNYGSYCISNTDLNDLILQAFANNNLRIESETNWLVQCGYITRNNPEGGDSVLTEGWYINKRN